MKMYRSPGIVILFEIFSIAIFGYLSGYAQVELSPRLTELEVSPFCVDAASFMDERGKTYIEVYYQISNASLKFTKLHGEYIASFQVCVSIFDEDGNLIGGDSFEQDLFATTFTESNLNSKIFIKTLQVPVSPGKYDLVVSVKDMDSRLTNEVKKKIKIADYAKIKGLVVSDRVFGSAIRQIGDKKVVIPNPLRIFGEINPTMIVYYEIYNNDFSRGKYLIRCEIMDKLSKVKQMKEKLLNLSGERVFQNHFQFEVGDLLSGKYFLRTRIGKINGSQRLELWDSFTVDRLSTWIAGNYDKTIQILQYIASDKEMAALRNAKEEDRKKAWLDFWKSKDPTPGTLQNEVMMEYYRRIRYANAHFTVLREGWTTDRGRIYIKYGPPDTIERHTLLITVQPHALAREKGKPYQNWYYYRINRKFHFVDKNNDGEYYLQPLDWNDPYSRVGTGIE